ncbi:MAG: hypothetical protein Q9170_002427 [Blastenia crenularia]
MSSEYCVGADASLAADYLAVTGDMSASYANKKTFQKNYLYSTFIYNQILIQVAIQNYGNFVNEAELLGHRSRIDKFDPHNPDTVLQYKSLFAMVGSNVITSAKYGGHMQLQVWADNSDSTVSSEFEADVSAKFSGLKGRKIDAGVKTESQCQTFQGIVQDTAFYLNGDPELAASLGSNSNSESVFKTFEKWVDSAGTWSWVSRP